MRLRGAHCAPAMRPLVHKQFWSRTDGPKMRPLCAHYVPTMRPLWPEAVLELNRFAMCANRFGVRFWSPSVPTMRPLFASTFFAFESMGPHCAPCAPTMLCFETVSGEIRCIDPRQRAHCDEKLANTFVGRARCGRFFRIVACFFVGGILGRLTGA